MSAEMDDLASIRLVEQFHLLFLAQLGRRVDKRLFVLKGGCNLRFFHRSMRYSDDMDLDLGDVDIQVLRDKVREVFASRPFVQILEARAIRVAHVTEHKQTDTTQRWKLGLRVQGSGAALPTKIEFSRPGVDEGVAFGSVDADIVRTYQVPPLMVSHYDAGTSLRQKLGALAGRRETQARDVFDLHHLIASGAASAAVEELDPQVVERASANAMTVDFAMFKSQVLAYLVPDDQAHYDSPAVWDTMVLEVIDALRAGRS
jgi:predicted nucleotidyltransferase component of viral defense system